MSARPREWDAETYERVAVPHDEWAEAVLSRLPLTGDETVLDAGCGTGRVTAKLLERLPTGRVIAVDGSSAMVEKVRDVIRPGDEALVADLTELDFDEPVDAVVSSAVFHWIADHDRLFTRLHAALRPGGRLVAQCGGSGNIARLRKGSEAVARKAPFAEHLEAMPKPWNYAAPEETEARLRAAGFGEVSCWLYPFEVTPAEPAEYLATVCLGPHIDALPDELGGAFVDEVLEREGGSLTLEYVRLNIDAVA